MIGSAKVSEQCAGRRWWAGFSTLLALVLVSIVTPVKSPAEPASTTGPRETPRDFVPFAQVETHRIRITNVVDGPIEVSTDKGTTWRILGRVTAPATESRMGYLASGYAPPSTVAAVAVHGLRVRVGDLSSAYPKMVNILPREFAQTPSFFGGHVAGASGVYTDIPVGTGIFRELSPYSGNPVYTQDQAGSLNDLPLNYRPAVGDVFELVVQRPANPLIEVDFENIKNGLVRAKFSDGSTKAVTHVLKPVYGVGRYDGCSYTGVGAINTSHTGVLTISTAPVSTSSLFEGTGDERRGGFQIMPSYHNSQSEEAWADSVMVLGTRGRELLPDLEGTPPLFMGHFNLCWLPQDPDHSWRVEVQYAAPPRPAPVKGQKPAPARRHVPEWRPMPTLVGTQKAAMRNITAIRLVRDSSGDAHWLAARIDTSATAYGKVRQQLARDGKMPVFRGQVSVDSGTVDARTKFVAFYIDGGFRNITNAVPFTYVWTTTDSADGEHLIEIRAEDENNDVLSTSIMHVWVDNSNQLPAHTAAR